ncbi:MAG: PAS domain S-box protein [Promethearchaeota archaeon]
MEQTRRHNALRKTLQKQTIFQSLFESSNVIIHILDKNGTIQEANPTAFSKSGYSEEEIIGRGFTDILSPSSQKLFVEQFSFLLEEGFNRQELELVSKDKKIITVDCSAFVVHNEQGEITAIIYFQNPTQIDETRVVEVIEEVKEKYQMLVEKLHDGVLLEDTEGFITFINPRVTEILGYTEDELVGWHISTIIPTEEVENFEKERAKVSQGESTSYESSLMNKDGSLVPVILSATPLFTDKGDFQGVLSVVKDITARKRILDTLKISEEQYRTTIDSMNDMIHVIDGDLRIILTNSAFREHRDRLGLEPNVIGRTVFEVFPFSPERVFEEYLQVFDTEVPLITEQSSIMGDKEYISEVRKIPIFDVKEGEREVSRIITIVRDITERKQAERILRESERKFRLLAEASLVGITIAQETQHKYVNDALAQIVGYSREEMLTWTTSEIFKPIHPDDLPFVKEQWQKKETGEKDGVVPRHQFRIVTKTNDLKWVEVFSHTIRYDGKPALLAAYVDITEQKRIEEELQYQLKVSRVLSGISARFVAFTSYKEAINATLEDIGELIHADRSYIFTYNNDFTAISDIHEWCASGVVSVLEKLDNLPLDIFPGLSYHLKGRDSISIQDVIRLPLEVQKEREILVKLKIRSMIAFPIFLGSEVAGFLAIVDTQKPRNWLEEDLRVLRICSEIIGGVLSRKRAEEANLQLLQELRQANEALKDFAFVVSHDLRAPLRGIAYLTDWLVQDYANKLDKEGKDRIDLLLTRVKWMNALIDGILQYSQVGRIHEEKTKVDLNKLITEVIELLNPPKHRFSIIRETELPVLYCEKTRMSQIFQNLIDNAIKFMDKPHGEIRISCVDKGKFWEFKIADNGRGIEEENLDKIFQIFYRPISQDRVPSSGIGLSLVKKIIEQEKGEIWAESKVKQGSVFYFTVPKVTENSKEN